ncbi:MAG: peptidoglycan-binding protein LysM [Candidatus Sedimenticola sp. 20ELBAFRAG]
MGLFDFVSNLGKMIFGDSDDPAEKIRESIEENNPGVHDLGVSFNDGVVHLSGDIASAEALEKTVLLAGNVRGVSEVNVDGLNAPEPTADVEYYTIEKGDSLWKIAGRFYGTGSDYVRLFEANREVIKDPDLIYPGQKIRVPAKAW